MRRNWASLTVGALVLVVTAVSYYVFRFTHEGVREGGYNVYALFRDAMGLPPKSRVVIAGLEVGSIVEKAPDEATGMARITVHVNAGTKIWNNALISKKSASLLGEYYLEIDPGTPFEKRGDEKVPHVLLKDGDKIERVSEPTSVGDLMNQIGTTLPLLQDILRDVHDLTSGQLKEIADNVNQTVARNSVVLERLLQRVDNIAAHIEGITREETDDIKVAIKNTREITEGLKSLVGTSEGQVSATGNELRSSIQKLQRSVDSLDRSLQNVETITGRLKEGEGTAGRLLTNDTVARNLEDITEDAGSFIRGITRLQTIVGLRSEYNYLAGTFKNYFSLTLAPRPDKFYLFEIVDDPRGYRQQDTEYVEDSKTGVQTTRKITTSDKLKFSLQFGKRFGFFTGRFGIKESTGGAGVDLHFLDDRLTLSADLFDARSNEYPRLQGRASIAIYNHNLFLVAGVDDLLNRRPARGTGGAFFDWFTGLQLVFKDEDLRSLLLFGGGAVGAAAK